jgi:hypothetical protein
MHQDTDEHACVALFLRATDRFKIQTTPQGLDVLSPRQLVGWLARPRRFEVAAALNRLRTLRVA